MIRDYSQAYNDLCKLICLLERNSEEKTGNGRPMNNGDDLDSARLRLSKMEEKSRKDIPLDMYKILYVYSSTGFHVFPHRFFRFSVFGFYCSEFLGFFILLIC